MGPHLFVTIISQLLRSKHKPSLLPVLQRSYIMNCQRMFPFHTPHLKTFDNSPSSSPPSSTSTHSSPSSPPPSPFSILPHPPSSVHQVPPPLLPSLHWASSQADLQPPRPPPLPRPHLHQSHLPPRYPGQRGWWWYHSPHVLGWKRGRLFL